MLMDGTSYELCYEENKYKARINAENGMHKFFGVGMIHGNQQLIYGRNLSMFSLFRRANANYSFEPRFSMGIGHIV